MQCIKALKLLHKVLEINVLQRINVKLTILTNTFSREAFSLSTPLMSEVRRKLGCYAVTLISARQGDVSFTRVDRLWARGLQRLTVQLWPMKNLRVAPVSGTASQSLFQTSHCITQNTSQQSNKLPCSGLRSGFVLLPGTLSIGRSALTNNNIWQRSGILLAVCVASTQKVKTRLERYMLK